MLPLLEYLNEKDIRFIEKMTDEEVLIWKKLGDKYYDFFMAYPNPDKVKTAHDFEMLIGSRLRGVKVGYVKAGVPLRLAIIDGADNYFYLDLDDQLQKSNHKKLIVLVRTIFDLAKKSAVKHRDTTVRNFFPEVS